MTICNPDYQTPLSPLDKIPRVSQCACAEPGAGRCLSCQNLQSRFSLITVNIGPLWSSAVVARPTLNTTIISSEPDNNSPLVQLSSPSKRWDMRTALSSLQCHYYQFYLQCRPLIIKSPAVDKLDKSIWGVKIYLLQCPFSSVILRRV